jgi:hypothetical protein
MRVDAGVDAHLDVLRVGAADGQRALAWLPGAFPLAANRDFTIAEAQVRPNAIVLPFDEQRRLEAKCSLEPGKRRLCVPVESCDQNVGCG